MANLQMGGTSHPKATSFFQKPGTATSPWWGVLAIPGLPLGRGRAESSSELS